MLNEPQNPPWTKWEWDGDYDIYQGRDIICSLIDCTRDGLEAFARLIAAAPELMAALESAREFIARIETELGWVVAEQKGKQIDRLLARVRGEEN